MLLKEGVWKKNVDKVTDVLVLETIRTFVKNYKEKTKKRVSRGH